SVAHDGHWIGAARTVIRRRDQPAGKRIYAQDVEVLASNKLYVHFDPGFGQGPDYLRDRDSAGSGEHAGEHALTVAHPFVKWVREAVLFSALINYVDNAEFLGISHWQRFQQDRVN